MNIKPKLPEWDTSIFTIMSRMAVEHNAINLAQGFPDWNCDDELLELVHHFQKKGFNQYAPMQGVVNLRKAISEKIKKLYKANIWYLVYGRGGTLHVVRVSQIVEAELLEDIFIRPPDFDLVEFWEHWCNEYDSHPSFLAKVRVSAPEALPMLAEYVGDRARGQLSQAYIPDADGWVTLDLPFESFVAARSRLLGLGRAVEVQEPEALRKSLIDFAEQIAGFYKKMKCS